MGGQVTEHQPTPQGRTGQAWRTLLARCHKAEQRNRDLLARIDNLTAQNATQDDDA